MSTYENEKFAKDGVSKNKIPIIAYSYEGWV